MIGDSGFWPWGRVMELMKTVLKWIGYGVMGIGMIPFLFIQSVVEEMEQKYLEAGNLHPSDLRHEEEH